MEYYIYLDSFLLLNTAANMVLLYCLQWILLEKPSFVKIWLASFAGSLGILVVLLFPFPVYGAAFVDALLMSRILYGKKDWSFHGKRGCLLYFMAFCLEGACRFGGEKTGWLFLLILSRIIGNERKRKSKTMDVTLCFRGKTLSLQGFVDTGNLLKEPITGKPVHIVSYEDIKGILPDSYQKAAENYFKTGTLESTKVSELQMYEFTFLSYHSIGKETGQLLGIRMDTAVFQNSAGKKTEEKAVIGLADQKIFLTGRCQMILNGRLEL